MKYLKISLPFLVVLFSHVKVLLINCTQNIYLGVISMSRIQSVSLEQKRAVEMQPMH